MTSISTESLCFADTVRAIEARANSALTSGALMQAAAQALAERTARHAIRRSPGAPIIALVGPGNNGGDALLAAMLLRERGFSAVAWQLAPQASPPADAAAVLEKARSQGFPIDAALAQSDGARAQSHAAFREAIARQALFIDGLFGIGLSRPLEGLARVWVEALNEGQARVIAADIPSGVDVDTGALIGGERGLAPRCIETVTFIADKPGLHTGAALDHVGSVYVADLGLGRPEGDGELLNQVVDLLGGLSRRASAHKGSHGSVRLIGGAPGMRGALILAALGAQRAGAGKVFVAPVDGGAASVDAYPELMSARPDDAFDGLAALVVGCGMGRSEAAAEVLDRAWASNCALVVDADGLNALASKEQHPPARDHPTVLTPHPLEAARLLDISAQAVQDDRIAAAREIAARWSAFTIVKGAGSVCAAPDGRWSILPTGSPALATAGSGDVLAGVIAAFIAQGLTAWDALRLAAWMHGKAAQHWSFATQRGGVIGLAASELPDWIRWTVNAELNDDHVAPSVR
jgi:hydroxyethylthiazole kinase-like uncharacterized protein yjeF